MIELFRFTGSWEYVGTYTSRLAAIEAAHALGAGLYGIDGFYFEAGR